jgi:hypothetical protein
MSARPTLPRRPAAASFVSAVLAALIAIGVLGAIVGLFQRDGIPFEQVVAAERACAGHAYASARDACVRADLAAAGVERVASRPTPALR